MDSVDPEKRISELERQLAQRTTAAAHQYRMTPDWVHNVAFSQSPRGTRGYNEDEVDELLDRVEGALRNPTARGAITAADVDRVVFSKPPIGKRGYSGNDVDAFLDLVKIELSRRSPAPGSQPGLTAPSQPVPPPAGIRQRLQLARGLVCVTDPDGVQWKIYRRWFPNWSLSWLHGADPGDLGAYLLAVLWPPWFVAKLLGVKWIIVIERAGGEMGDVRVRGWLKSQRRIRELANSAAAGTLTTELRS